MQIEEIVELKYKLEKEIKLFITEKFSDFELATKLYPSSITIDTFEAVEIGEKPKMIISDVDIKVEL